MGHEEETWRGHLNLPLTGSNQLDSTDHHKEVHRHILASEVWTLCQQGRQGVWLTQGVNMEWGLEVMGPVKGIAQCRLHVCSGKCHCQRVNIAEALNVGFPLLLPAFFLQKGSSLLWHLPPSLLTCPLSTAIQLSPGPVDGGGNAPGWGLMWVWIASWQRCFRKLPEAC